MASKTTVKRIIAPDAVTGIGELVAQYMPTTSLLLVCDDTTWNVAGERIRASLTEDYDITIHSLGSHPRATLSAAKALAEQATSGHGGLLAIGAGTVNDVTKYAATLAQQPYICIATAASMNGYSSATASLEDQGMKYSLPAMVARAVVADTSIIAAAPKRLTRAGFGDTLCRPTVEADMLLSHLLLDSDYPRHLFDIIRRHESALIAQAASTKENSTKMSAMLMEALLDAGDAMASYGSSAVASQGEHMIAHALDLIYGGDLHTLLHGEIIAVTTITMLRLQRKMLLRQPVVKPILPEQSQFESRFGKKYAADLTKRYTKKTISAARATQINERIASRWLEIKAAMLEIMISPGSIESAFLQLGLAVNAAGIGISEESYSNATNCAYLTRERFTFLDLAAMTGKRVV